jgi:hypothetical protein
MTTKERIEEFFADCFCEAEEAMKAGDLTAEEAVDCFASALMGWHSYFQTSADVYEKLINAIITRYRN